MEMEDGGGKSSFCLKILASHQTPYHKQGNASIDVGGGSRCGAGRDGDGNWRVGHAFDFIIGLTPNCTSRARNKRELGDPQNHSRKFSFNH